MHPSEDLESRGAKNRGGSYSSSSVVEDLDTQWVSWLVPIFVVANVAVFVVAMYINNCPKENSRVLGKCVAGFLGRFSFQPLKENPLFGPSSRTMEKLGALDWNKVVNKHQGWRLVTCIWLHDSSNCKHVELGLDWYSTRTTIWFCADRSDLPAVRIWRESSIISIYSKQHLGWGFRCSFRLVGSYALRASHKLVHPYKQINLVIGILPHVGTFAHIGGFLTGFFLGFILMARPQFGWMEGQNLPADVHVKSKYKAYQYVCWVVSLVLLIVGFTVGLVMLYRKKNGNEHCHWCHYLTCVPTSSWHCDET